MKKIVQLVLFSVLLFSVPLQGLASISEAVGTNLGQNNAAVTIRDAKSGEIVYSHNGKKLMRPASNMKLVSGAAALAVLGEDYRFTTGLYVDGTISNKILNGNVYIKGTGDPTLKKDDFLQFAKVLKNHGIHTINGLFVADDKAFAGSTLPPGVEKADESYYFGARTSAITMSQNDDFDASTVIITATPGKTGAKPVYAIEPNGSGMAITNQAKTVSKGSRNTLTIKRSYNTNRIIISGNLPQGSTKKEWVTLQDPTKNTMQAMKLAFESAGIKFSKQSFIAMGTVPQNAKLLYTKESRPLSAIFPAFMKLSNNSIADILVKAMGRQELGVGSTEVGVTVLKAYGQSLHIPMDNWRFIDGSGLSNANRMTTIGLSQLLYEVQNEPYYQTFFNSLPVAGNKERFIGGTLRHRLAEPSMQNRIYAKTGYIPNVYTLSGYMKGRSGKQYIFSIFLENKANGNLYIDRTMAAIIKNL